MIRSLPFVLLLLVIFLDASTVSCADQPAIAHSLQTHSTVITDSSAQVHYSVNVHDTGQASIPEVHSPLSTLSKAEKKNSRKRKRYVFYIAIHPYDLTEIRRLLFV